MNTAHIASLCGHSLRHLGDLETRMTSVAREAMAAQASKAGCIGLELTLPACGCHLAGDGEMKRKRGMRTGELASLSRYFHVICHGFTLAMGRDAWVKLVEQNEAARVIRRKSSGY